MKQTSDEPLTYQEAFKIRKRMCKYSDRECSDCPLKSKNNSKRVDCNAFMRIYPELAEPILKKWAAEHPTKTNRDKFIEVFGNPKFTDKTCEPPCACIDDVPCISCDWWDEEYIKPEGTDEQ